VIVSNTTVVGAFSKKMAYPGTSFIFLMTTQSLSQFIKSTARNLGFQYCGISKAGFLAEEAPRLENWLKNNMHGKMNWMEEHFEKRLDPSKLVVNAQSVISLLLNYFPDEKFKQPENVPKISKYAFGNDYHFVIKDKLINLLNKIREYAGDIHGRCFVDSAPVMDKAWAAKSGLGWIGKNSNLITREMGSFLFIAELILDIPLEYDAPIKDYCGDCRLCLDACPTNAISQPYVVDGSKCISYFTIELKSHEKIPVEMKGKFENWIFGCDICQDVCPWNRFSKPTLEKDFQPDDKLLGMTQKDWEEITEDVFNKVFKGSPLQRAKYEGVKRNLKFLCS